MPSATPKIKPTIRRATISDLAAITEIYNEAIMNTLATFDMKPKTMDEQLLWFKSHTPKHPIMIADIDGQVIGWSSLSEWSERCAYEDTTELSIYIKPEFQGRGIGTEIVKMLLTEAAKYKIHSVIARIESSNQAIIHLLRKFDFQHVGLMKEVGSKFGKRLDVVIMQLVLPN